MATAVLYIGFGHPHVPAEAEKAFGWMMQEGEAYLKSMQGKYFERAEQIALTAHGGHLAGMILLFGERAKLDELRRTDEFEAFSMNMGRRFSHLTVVPGLNREGIDAVMKRVMKK